MGEEKKSKAPKNLVPMAIATTVLEFIAMFFACIASPWDVFKKDLPEANGTGPRCYSVWGMKACGPKHPGTWHDASYYKVCGVFEASMKAAASFSCVSIFATCMCAVISILMACKCAKTKVPLILFSIFGVVSTSIPFAVIAGLYHNSTCGTRFKDAATYQPGFAFFVVAFCIQTISTIVAIAA